MPRNEAKPVSEHDAYHANKVRNACIGRHVADRPVALSYTKRDGTKSRSVGKIAFFSGREGFDTHSVTIETEDKGPRTINLHRVFKVE